MSMLVVWLNYGIPSVLLIIFFLKFLNRPEFKYSFYRVLQCDMILNLVCYVNTWIQRLCNVSDTIPTMVWFYENAYFLFHIQAYFAHFFFNGQAMSVTLLSLHRLSSSISIMGNGFWSKYFLHAYIIIITLCFAITSPIYFGGYVTPNIYINASQTFQSRPIEADKKLVFSFVFSLEMWSYFSLIGIINVCTLWAVRKRFSADLTSPKTKTLMRNLTTIAFLNTAVFASIILWQPFYKKVVEIDRQINSYVMMFMTDALSLSQPYLLLICDRNVRSTVVKMIGEYLGPATMPTRNSVMHRTASVARIV